MRGRREEQLCRYQDEERVGGGVGCQEDSFQPVEKARRKLPSLSPWGTTVEQISTLQSGESPCHSNARALEEAAAHRQPMEMAQVFWHFGVTPTPIPHPLCCLRGEIEVGSEAEPGKKREGWEKLCQTL